MTTKRYTHRCLAMAIALICCLSLSAAKRVKTIPAETRTVDGLTVKVTYLTDDIVRVVKYKGDAMPAKESFSVVLKTPTATQPNLKATIGDDGLVSFADKNGEVLLRETAAPTLVACKSKADAGKYEISQTWTLRDDEAVYGLGQLRDGYINQRGREVTLWNHNTFIAIPYIASERGYGLYWDNAGRTYYKDSADGMQFRSEVAPCVDYYVIYRDGTMDGVIAGIRDLSGQATMFPRWTLGHWQCRERYKTSDELAEVLDRYRELHIPLDAIVQDWQYWGCDSNWNAMRFMNPYYINKVGDPAWEKYLPKDLRQMAQEYKEKGLSPRLKSPEEMVGYVHNRDAHLMISIWASFGPWTEPYKELEKIGALLPFHTWPRNNGVRPYDPFNPKARDIYWKHLSHLYQMGFDAWWTDSTEPDHFDETEETDDHLTYCGSWRSVKNAFPLMTNRGIYEHQRAMKGNTKRSVQMTRSGAFGLQRYGAFSWSGDISASWKEMKQQIPSGLSYSLCGIPFWNTDLGGFFYWDFDQSPRNPALKELQTRWMQWGTFMPLMRNHCSSPMVSELYEFGSEGDWAYDGILRFIRLRYRLLPYIYSLAGDATLHAGTIMRPLVMDFPRDKKATRLTDSYMFGKALFVKPVTDPAYTWKDGKRGHVIYPDVKQAAAPVSVYLPEGAEWYDFFSGERHQGGKTLLRPTSIMEMPVYVRAGSIVPMGPFVQHSAEQTGADLEIRVYPGADGRFTLYEDEGDGYNYERGQYTEIPFSWDDASRTLTIGDRRGAYKGMLSQRTFRIAVAPKGDAVPAAFDATVDYSGKQVTVKL